MNGKTYVYDERKRCYVLAPPDGSTEASSSRSERNFLQSSLKVIVAVVLLLLLAWSLLAFLYGSFSGGGLELMDIPF